VRLELLGKTLPVPSFHEICWSVPDHVLTFCCLSDKVVGELQELFRESFSLGLAPYAPWDIEKTGTNPQDAAAGSSSRNLALPSLPPGVDPMTVGREFLTWLWFKSEVTNGMIRIPGGGESEIVFVRAPRPGSRRGGLRRNGHLQGTPRRSQGGEGGPAPGEEDQRFGARHR
jgi:recombination associated protein RdgC